MNVTNDVILEFISNNRNKKHFRVRHYVQKINKEISGLRLMAKEKAGTYLAYWCNREANLLEKRLNESLLN